MHKRLGVLSLIILTLPLFASASSCPSLTRTLARGMKGSDVTQLQQFLVDQKMLPADYVTGFFGAGTEGAVKKFQCAQMNICSGTPATTGWGMVGKTTRTAITAVCSVRDSTVPASVPVTYTQPVDTSHGGGNTPPQCTPLPPETQNIGCAPGQTGTHTRARTSSCPVGATIPVWSEWVDSNMCTPPISARYWFAPLPPLPTSSARPYSSALDYMNLFDANAPWSAAQSHINVFKLYGEWLLTGNATDAQLQKVVAFVKAHNMKLAVEAGPLYPTASCGNGIEGFSGAQWPTYVSRIKAAGGTIDIVDMDEPYYFAHTYTGTQACNWSADTIAAKVQSFAQYIRGEFPTVIIGDTEPIIVGSAADFHTWFTAYRQSSGGPLAHLHLDVQWSTPNWASIAKYIEAASRADGVPFGMIYNADVETTDQLWIEHAGDHVKAYELQNAGNPDQVVFQSWNDKPDYSLPETTPYTFTNFINAYFGDKSLLGGQSPIPTGLFMIGSTVYYSNGSHYCMFDTWDNFRSMTGLNTTAGITVYAQVPGSMVSDGVCSGPRNLAMGKSATASGAVAGSEAAKAIDNDQSTIWSAGGGAPQWVQIDLGAAYSVSEIKLLAEQTPSGQTTHVVTLSADGDHWVTGTTFAGVTSSGQVLDYKLPTLLTTRYVKVSTTDSPSWIAWREIQVMGN